ncbi:hypothetical protein PT974_03400 [Cladobotryum mycophilum]|uniref:Uncharacterized protein n=1 Tax=Cladobotryum mycophilum TaxID=491253 RepID=A0ABR0STF4_9HYPO
MDGTGRRSHRNPTAEGLRQTIEHLERTVVLTSPPPPPLSPVALRLSILAGLEIYNTNYAAFLENDEIDPRSTRTHAMRLGMTRAHILLHISELSCWAEKLERQLLSRRQTEWTNHCFLALINQVAHIILLPALALFLSGTHLTSNQYPAPTVVAQLDTVLYMLQWFGYPIALYRIGTFEKGIAKLGSLREGLKAIERQVDGFRKAQSTACFDGATWNYIPWRLVRKLD